MSATLAIVSNLGHMKAYRRETDPLDRVTYKLIESAENREALEQKHEKLSDRSGNFHGVGGSGSSGETEKIGLESEKRAMAHVVEWISQTLQAHGGGTWHIALPVKINKRVMEQLGADERKGLGKNLTADLTGIAPADLVKYFK